MKKMALIACLMITPLLMGCVGVVPVRSNSKEPQSGQLITREQIKFIVLGQTTRGEVTNHFGADFRESPRVPAIAYSWEIPGGQGCWWVCVPEGGVAGEFEWNHWRALFMTFGVSGRVTTFEFVRLSNGKSLDEQLERWAERHKEA